MHPERHRERPRPGEFARHWALDPETVFLNHGSFGACPRPVLDFQSELRAQLERDPVSFFVRRYERLFDEARVELATFIGAEAEGLVLLPNATTGVNTVLRSIEFDPGDELIVTDHEYNACRNAIDVVAARRKARVVIVPVPFPLADPGEVGRGVLDAASDRTRLVLIDHITSPTGMVLPVAELIAPLRDRGIETLVDGAHGPGMLPLALEDLGATYYAGNCHKWICTPKGAGFLYVNKDARAGVRPLVISHGTNSERTDRSRYHLEFDWTGTLDPTPYLCIPRAIEFMGTLLGGGWEALRRHNRDLVLQGREILCRSLGLEPPCPDEMIASLGTVILENELPAAGSRQGGPAGEEKRNHEWYQDPMEKKLYERYGITVPVILWPHPPRRMVRVSGQIYNTIEQYQYLADAICDLWRRQS